LNNDHRSNDSYKKIKSEESKYLIDKMLEKDYQIRMMNIKKENFLKNFANMFKDINIVDIYCQQDNLNVPIAIFEIAN